MGIFLCKFFIWCNSDITNIYESYLCNELLLLEEFFSLSLWSIDLSHFEFFCVNNSNYSFHFNMI